eukprot:scaffold82322_cov66-Phaeocystis_antarctica.AAC.9
MGEVFGEVTIDKKADTNSLTVSKISVSQALPGKSARQRAHISSRVRSGGFSIGAISTVRPCRGALVRVGHQLQGLGVHEQLHPLPRALVRVHRVARAEDEVAQPGPKHEAVRVAVARAADRLDAVDRGEWDGAARCDLIRREEVAQHVRRAAAPRALAEALARVAQAAPALAEAGVHLAALPQEGLLAERRERREHAHAPEAATRHAPALGLAARRSGHGARACSARRRRRRREAEVHREVCGHPPRVGAVELREAEAHHGRRAAVGHLEVRVERDAEHELSVRGDAAVVQVVAAQEQVARDRPVHLEDNRRRAVLRPSRVGGDVGIGPRAAEEDAPLRPDRGPLRLAGSAQHLQHGPAALQRDAARGHRCEARSQDGAAAQGAEARRRVQDDLPQLHRRRLGKVASTRPPLRERVGEVLHVPALRGHRDAGVPRRGKGLQRLRRRLVQACEEHVGGEHGSGPPLARQAVHHRDVGGVGVEPRVQRDA